MCRNIRPLFNFEPEVTDDEIHAASLQFVRKVSGFTKPSQVNQEAFDLAVVQIAAITRDLMGELTTSATPKSREEEATKAKVRAAKRYSQAG